MTNLYSILQVERTAEPEVIRAAHRALARKHHPDFGGDARRMAAINLAWSILGNPDRRARYDAMPDLVAADAAAASSMTNATAGEASPAGPAMAANGPEMPTRRSREERSGGTVLDFGRYAGWTVGNLADHDPNYLRWLSRTPIGRRLTVEIEGALERRNAEAAALRPDVPASRRTGLFGGLGSLRAAAR